MGRAYRDSIATPRIVQHETHSGWLWWLLPLLVVALAVVGWFAFDYGRQSAGYFSSAASEEILALKAHIAELEKEREAFRSVSAKHERSSQISRNAAAKVQEDIQRLEEEKAELRRRLALLEELMVGEGFLKVTDLSVKAGADSQKFNYEFSVKRTRGGTGWVEGRIAIKLAGMREGEHVTLSLNEVSNVPFPTHKMRFRNFQVVDGVLDLPEGFTPESIIVEVRPEGDDVKEITSVHEWLITEP